MHVLLIGAGGREHAIAGALRRSPLLSRLSVAPGNAGLAQMAERIMLDVADHAAVIDYARQAQVDFVVIGPEAPLVAGLVDDLKAAGIRAFGPERTVAKLEGSKRFTKELCREAGIPTAAALAFTDKDSATAYVHAHGAPLVVKADGLAAGKGVTVAMTVEEALDALTACFDGTFGAAGATVLLEDMLTGEEVSFFALVDGTYAVPFGTASDHKRVGEGDTGPNTGGMGAYSPTPRIDAALSETIMASIIRPTVETLAKRGTPYRGILFAGLMLTQDGPKLIEYNVRLGDPEAEVILPRLESDLLALLLAVESGKLATLPPPCFTDQSALTVVMASKGYPGAFVKGTPIRHLPAAENAGVSIFHAGTEERDGALLAMGGRVLAITALGDTLDEARQRAYHAVDNIIWPDGFCRRDIGWRALQNPDRSA